MSEVVLPPWPWEPGRSDTDRTEATVQEPWPLQLSGQWAVFSSNNAGDRGWGALGRREGLLALSEGVAKTDTTDRRTVVAWSILLGVGVKGDKDDKDG